MSLFKNITKLVLDAGQLVGASQALVKNPYQNVVTKTTSTMTTRGNKAKKIDMASIEANIELPVKPKKPITPWVAFVRDRKDDVLRQGHRMTAAQMAVILSKEWKEIDKTKYENEYQRRHDEYVRQVQDYQNSLTDEHRDYLNLKKASNREKKALKELKKTNIPVLPRNCANLFVHERCKQSDVQEQMKIRKPSEVFSDLFREYRNLSEADKKKYIDLQEEDRSRFQHEFLEWYESVQNNDELGKSARELANSMRDRLKAVNYV